MWRLNFRKAGAVLLMFLQFSPAHEHNENADAQVLSLLTADTQISAKILPKAFVLDGSIDEWITLASSEQLSARGAVAQQRGTLWIAHGKLSNVGNQLDTAWADALQWRVIDDGNLLIRQGLIAKDFSGSGAGQCGMRSHTKLNCFGISIPRQALFNRFLVYKCDLKGGVDTAY